MLCIPIQIHTMIQIRKYTQKRARAHAQQNDSEHFHKDQFYRITSIMIYLYEYIFIYFHLCVATHLVFSLLFSFLQRFVFSSVCAYNAFESFAKFDNNNMTLFEIDQVWHT